METGSEIPNTKGSRIPHTITTTSHVEFLRSPLRHSFTPCLVSNILNGIHKSIECQCESCWNAFHCFLISHPEMEILKASVLTFHSLLFHSQGRSKAMIACHTSALLNPLLYSYNISLSPRLKGLFRRGLFLQHLTPKPPTLSWSLYMVMKQIAQDHPEGMFINDLLNEECFLITLTSGLRVLQLWALTHFPEQTTFADDGSR